MKKRATNDEKRIFQIKVTLKYTRPPIWRRILVPDTLSLGRFHDVLQVVMGWTDNHAHQFVKGGACMARDNWKRRKSWTSRR
jgi:hypothetical protein